MLTAIIVYVSIGAAITFVGRNKLARTVKGESLATRISFYIAMVVIAPVCAIYGFMKVMYDELFRK